MIVTFFRTLIIFITLLVLMRLMGKRQIGEMQPFEFIVTLIIADLACIPMADVSIPLVYGIVATLCLFILHQLFSILEKSGRIFKRVISGKPSIVINSMGVDIVELKKNNLGVDDLIESMRSLGYFSFDQLSYAIFESNGKLSALESPTAKIDNPSIPILLIENGKIDLNNANVLNSSTEDIKNFLCEKGIKTKSVEVMTIDGNGRTYVKEKNEKYKIFSFPVKEGVRW